MESFGSDTSSLEDDFWSRKNPPRLDRREFYYPTDQQQTPPARLPRELSFKKISATGPTEQSTIYERVTLPSGRPAHQVFDPGCLNNASQIERENGATRPLSSDGSQYTQTSARAPNYKRDTFPCKMIEVSRGICLRLRGADETWKAIAVDFYMPCGCLSCLLTIFCIQDADYVLCPVCRVVSPMEGATTSESDGGVGLGFTMGDLAKWQGEIQKNRYMY